MRPLRLFPKGFLKFYILKILEKGPTHGYGIMTKIKERTGWKASPGTIYPALHKLKEDGFIREIKSKERVKCYKITQKGLKLIQQLEKFREEIEDRFENFLNVISQLLGVEEKKLRMEIRKLKRERKFFYIPTTIRREIEEILDLTLEKLKSKKKGKKIRNILHEAKEKLKML